MILCRTQCLLAAFNGRISMISGRAIVIQKDYSDIL